MEAARGLRACRPSPAQPARARLSVHSRLWPGCCLRRHPVPIVRSLRPPPVRPRTPCPRAVYAILARASSRPAYVYRIDYRMAEYIVVAGTGLDPPRVRTSLFRSVGSVLSRSVVRATRLGQVDRPRARGPARRLSAPLRRTGVYCFHVGFLTIRAGTMPTACRPSASRGRLHHWGCPAPSS